MRYNNETFDELINQTKSGERPPRSLISLVKGRPDFIQETYKRTSFLDEYNCDIPERLYNLIHDRTSPVPCRFCGRKAIFGKSFNEGYSEICNDKKCRSKLQSIHGAEHTYIASNRDEEFKKKQAAITYVDDEVIKDLIKIERQYELIDNPIIIDYLRNRFNDNSTDDLLEPIQRIFTGTFVRPKCACPDCDNYTLWNRRRDRLYTRHCSCECANRNPETIKKKEKTFIEKYGMANPLKNIEINNDFVETHKDELDIRVKFEMPQVIMDKLMETTYRNGISGSSKEEDFIAECFTELGYKFERHHTEDRFPFNVDFYIPECDLFVEYQGSQYHNRRAYFGTPDDIKDAERILDRHNRKVLETGDKKTMYSNIIYVWTDLDVRKRTLAKNEHINYLEIYKCYRSEDLKNQLFMLFQTVPDGHIFSFGDDELRAEFEYYKEPCFELQETVSTRNKIIKQFQENTFYKAEKEMYHNDPIIRRKVIQNRTKYLKKPETWLTPSDIMSGFKKSGIYYGYSHFNPKWTSWFINKENIGTVYDPCGGWGHHMLGMQQCSKIIYNDLSTSVCKGVEDIKNYFGMDYIEIHNEDARTYIPEDVDAFFMCPPYYNLEKYECGDFASLIEYKQFLNDIFEIWDANSAKVFGLIIREDYYELIQRKPSESYLVNTTKSHFGKSLEERFYIFRK